MLRKTNPPFVTSAESFSFIYLCRFCPKAQRGSKSAIYVAFALCFEFTSFHLPRHDSQDAAAKLRPNL